ncbi:hypothetical protein [Enterobacter cloacae]|uniref:hypothetical protein n=1 Tax=Enterobacter cloacae TaxID=550 RepID=UPI0020068FB0|nr:hypothetical protein [Enterobacter cloacae]ELV2768960.1 hypothetical protein [Enterobacter cloacae]ELV2779182.1 hypothetical protein [Enterobacter cloacae]MCK6713177.1 hypothetical protein [Enterobacter cloacae]MCK7386859.1 hypothetical protein [Enterobacter cloacae]MDM6889837.1 hypothetical protein [Enterobacter cloacae]
MSDCTFDCTTGPVEAEVFQAIAGYKMALINAHYRNFWHRFLCKLKDKEALKNERILVIQEKQCRFVVNKSPEHIQVLKSIIDEQSVAARIQDKFSNLIEPSCQSAKSAIDHVKRR